MKSRSSLGNARAPAISGKGNKGKKTPQRLHKDELKNGRKDLTEPMRASEHFSEIGFHFLTDIFRLHYGERLIMEQANKTVITRIYGRDCEPRD